MRVGRVFLCGCSQRASPSASASSRLHQLACAQLTVSCPDSLTSRRLASQMPRHIRLGFDQVWPSIIFTPTSTSKTTLPPFHFTPDTSWKREAFVCFCLFIAPAPAAYARKTIFVLVTIHGNPNISAIVLHTVPTERLSIFVNMLSYLSVLSLLTCL